jgi:replicative DNA helicase
MAERKEPPPDRIRAGLDSLVRARAGIIEPQPLTMKTEIFTLDYMLGGGLRVGEVSIVAARTGGGKTALAEQISLAISSRYKTHHFALELGYRQTENRMIGKICGLDVRSVENIRATNPKHELIVGALEALTYERDLLIEERDLLERYVSEDLVYAIAATNARLVVVDHPRHLDDWSEATGRFDMAPSKISRRFLAVAKQLECHIMVIAQMKAEVIKGRRPGVYDIADTSALGQVASAVVIVHRPFLGENGDDVAELIVDKNRNGPEGRVYTRWVGRTMSFLDLTPDEERRVVERCNPPKKKART